MRFVFGAPDAVKASPEVIDQILQPSQPGGGNGEGPGGDPGGNPGGEGSSETPPQPTETGRTVEPENAVCDAGFSGVKTRTREATSWSDGSVTYSSWTGWNTSACVEMAAVRTVRIGENRACADGFYGADKREGEIRFFADGSSLTHWFDWGGSGCLQKVSGRWTTVYEYAACPSGQIGNQYRYRRLTYMNDQWNKDALIWGVWSTWGTTCVWA